MPQFDSTFFASEIFWTIASYLVLFVVLGRWVLPRITSILQQRTRLIEEEIAQAKNKRREAEQLKNEYAAKLAGIEKDAKQMFDACEKRIIERRKQLMGEWKHEMERKKREFLEDAEVETQRAMREIRTQSADFIAEATGKLIHQKVDESEAQQMLTDVIEELEKHPIKKN